MKEVRTEHDSLGEVEVPNDRYYGAQTQRSLDNFSIGHEVMPEALIRAYAIVKKAAAITNCELDLLPQDKMSVISQVCDEIIDGKLKGHFPLRVWQTGSGTQTNMNVNEVIANRANELLGGELGSKTPIHPNDDVNKSQSTNDSFPTAMHIASCLEVKNILLPALGKLLESFKSKAEEFQDIVKIGRTHLMDATPLTLGQEFSGYACQIEHATVCIEEALPHLSHLALGGTAVGTGINTHPNYARRSAEVIAELTSYPFSSAPNKFEALASNDAIVHMSGALRRLACALFKIANDIRLLGSGPRCGIGELKLPANEPGSSIMPGKVNPTQSEALTMVCAQVIGNDAAIGFAGSQGHLELNVFKPVLIFNLCQSIRILADAANCFRTKCVDGIEPNHQNIQDNLSKSLMLATVLNTHIGYDKASQIVKKAYLENTTLKEAALALGLLSEEEFDTIVDPKQMVGSSSP